MIIRNLLLQLILMIHNVNVASQTPQPKTLHRRKPVKQFTTLKQIQLFLLILLVSIILMIIVFTFIPPLESGLSYRFINYI